MSKQIKRVHRVNSGTIKINKCLRIYHHSFMINIVHHRMIQRNNTNEHHLVEYLFEKKRIVKIIHDTPGISLFP